MSWEPLSRNEAFDHATCMAQLQSSYKEHAAGYIGQSHSSQSACYPVRRAFDTANMTSCADFAADADVIAFCASELSMNLGPAVFLANDSNQLHLGFDPAAVEPYDTSRFDIVGKLQDAVRNRGVVYLMRENSSSKLVAVKCMPNTWMRSCHEEFISTHLLETEFPWRDIGCINFLNDVGYPYTCQLGGVYRDEHFTYVVTQFASAGDLFRWSLSSSVPCPGVDRENIVRPIMRQIFDAVRKLHELSIVHNDLSLENICLTSGSSETDVMEVRLIDFSMASSQRVGMMSPLCAQGKASYQAPEVDSQPEWDGFQSDVFSLGVCLYVMLIKEYPWMATKPFACKSFDYFLKYGFRHFISKKKVRGTREPISTYMSEPVIQLLEGLFRPNPSERLTLGQSNLGIDKKRLKTVWDEAWLCADSTEF